MGIYGSGLSFKFYAPETGEKLFSCKGFIGISDEHHKAVVLHWLQIDFFSLPGNGVAHGIDRNIFYLNLFLDISVTFQNFFQVNSL